MNFAETLVIAFLGLLALSMQVFATLRVRKSPSYATDQKSAQMKLIWLLPVVGAAMVLSVLHQDGELFQKARTTQQGPRALDGQSAALSFAR